MYRLRLFVFCTTLASTLLFTACTTNRKLSGEYRSSVFSPSKIIHLEKDGTGYYTWWTDIQMFNNGTWTVSNDTLFFEDQSLLHSENKFFLIKNKRLTEIEEHPEIYKKLNFIQRMSVYRGR